MRSGTLPHPLVVGIGAACEIAVQEMTYDLEHVRRLSKRLVNGITSQLDFVVRNGDPEMTYEGITATKCVCFYNLPLAVCVLHTLNSYSQSLYYVIIGKATDFECAIFTILWHT